MTDAAHQLLPAPHSVRTRDDALVADRLLFVAGGGPPRSLVSAAADFLTDRAGLVATGSSLATAASRTVRFEVRDDLPPQGYRLQVDSDGAVIEANDRSGFLYGAITLRQWLSLHGWSRDGGSVPGVEIRDRPDFERRGYLLDISRNKVPHLTTLFRLVDLLAELKYNELQLYMEHTFAYPGHERVWAGADPLTPAEIQQLDGYCRLRGLQLVPNQNSFGHFHRWLVHEPYRRLAECPEGIEHPFSDEPEPFSLCPVDPDALALLRDLYGKLLPNFTSGRFHVGFDETFEVGRGRSRTACETEGLAEVFLRFLEAVRRLAAEHGRRVLIWADMLLEHRDLLERMPDDVILCEWGYEAGHPFREDAAVLSATGCEVYVCPGTSSWASFAGRGANMRANLHEAATAGLATAAHGYLVTDWGDRGHLQPLSASYPALAAGAANAWHGSESGRRDPTAWAEALDRWVFDAPGAGLGAAIQRLADVYLMTGASQKNGTALFHLLVSPERRLRHPRYRGLSTEGIGRARAEIDQVAAAIDSVEVATADAKLAKDEQRWAADALRLACEVGRAQLDSPFAALNELDVETRSRISTALGHLAERRLSLWIQRNREGGWEDSLRRLTRLEALLEA